MGVDQRVFVDGFTLLSDCSFTNNIDEQEHGRAASLHRDHKQYGYSTLVNRSTLKSLVPFFQPSALQRRLAVLEKRLDIIDRRQPSKIGGRQMLIGESAKKRKRQGFDDSGDVFVAMQGEMASSCKNWDHLNLAERGRYEEKADERRHATVANLKEARGALETEISDLKRQHALELAENGTPNHVSRCELLT